MVGVLGLALICAAVLLLFYVARRRNSPNPPRWSRLGVTEHTTLILFLVGAVFGGSLILLLFIRKGGPQFGMTELVLSLGVGVMTVVLWRLIDRIPRLGQPANAEMPTPAAAGPRKKQAA